jgi:hypothetical protein
MNMGQRDATPISTVDLLELINDAVQQSDLQHVKDCRACAVTSARREDDPRRFVVTSWSGGTEFAHFEAQRMVVDLCIPQTYYLAH